MCREGLPSKAAAGDMRKLPLAARTSASHSPGSACSSASVPVHLQALQARLHRDEEVLTVHLSAAGKLFSKAVSSGRQPVEPLFKLLDWTAGEKTGVQRASKGRSCWERLARAFRRYCRSRSTPVIGIGYLDLRLGPRLTQLSPGWCDSALKKNNLLILIDVEHKTCYDESTAEPN